MASEEAELVKIGIAVENLGDTMKQMNESLKRIAATLETGTRRGPEKAR